MFCIKRLLCGISPSLHLCYVIDAIKESLKSGKRGFVSEGNVSWPKALSQESILY